MSISLNNIETRVKILEQNKLNSNVVKIWTGSISNGETISTSQNISDFGILFLIADGQTSGYYGSCNVVTDYLISSKYSTCLLPTSGGNVGDFMRLEYINSRSLKIVDHNGLRHVIGVYGLKLYYSFSYNIIYRAKHLLENIFMS